MIHVSKGMALSGFIGLAMGILIVLGIRFFTYSPEQTHYHANFAVYINGQREQFKSSRYYEEVSGSCATGNDIKPVQRAHMHDNVNNVVHVHDHAVTWGDFFSNIDWAVGPDFIRTPNGVYTPTAEKGEQITYLLNGQAVDTIATTVIGNEDRLLINFGNTSNKVIQERYKAVAHTAHEINHTQDPAACMGNAGPTWKDRLQHLL